MSQPRWSVDAFSRFWDRPDPALVPAVLTDDVVGIWPGRSAPAVGREEYTQCIASLLTALPDLRLEVAESATSGRFTFVRWVMHATGREGRFEVTGVDRVELRDGLVCENLIFVDTALFQARAGIPVPWAEPSSSD